MKFFIKHYEEAIILLEENDQNEKIVSTQLFKNRAKDGGDILNYLNKTTVECSKILTNFFKR